MISYRKLHRILDYNSETGIFIWKITRGNKKKGTVAGNLNKQNGYIQININKKKYKAHRLAWFYIYGYWPENDIDHIDRTRHHNWISNLRESSKICNARNCGNRKNNTSGVKGVFWYKQNQKWVVQIGINQKVYYLGSFKNFDEAVCHRLAAEQCINWSGCDESSPAYQYIQRVLKI